MQAILLCLFLLPLYINAQQKFNKFYAPQAIFPTIGNYQTNGTMNDIVVDPQTNDIYMVGEIRSLVYNPGYVSDFGYLGKLNSSGNPQWLKNNSMSSSGQGENRYTRLIITSDNNLLALTGYFAKGGHSSGPNSGYTGQLTLHKTDKNGNILFQKNYGGSVTTYTSASDGRSLIEAKDASNAISYVAAGMYLTTYSTSPTSSESIFVVKTQTNLIPLWRKFYSFYNSGYHLESANCIYQAGDKNYILTGVSDGLTFVMKINEATGAVMWSHKYSISNAVITNSVSSGESITEDCNGNIVVSGACGGGVFLLSLSSAGVYNWCDVLNCGTSGNTLMKDPATNVLSLGGASISGFDRSTFLLKFTPGSCNNLVTNTYGNCVSYKMDSYNFSNMLYKKMLRTASGGYMFLNESVPYTAAYDDYKFNIVSTDSSFKSSAGAFDMSDYCTPHSQTVTAVGLAPIISGTASSSGTVLSEDVYYTLVQARLQQYTYCKDCPEPSVSRQTLHVKCHDRVVLSGNCDGETVAWFDENGTLMQGVSTHSLSFIATHSTSRILREYTRDSCVRCEKTFNIIVAPPDVCFSLPPTICINQAVTPTLTCDMSKVSWHQWVVTELNGAWNNRVVKGSFPFGGPPQAGIDIKSLWNGFIPGKCYGISLDIQDSCGNNNTLYQFFCVPALIQNTITVTVCPLNGNTTRWFEPSQHCSGAYYTFLGNDSRDYAYGYPLSPGNYILDCFDASGCQTGRTTVRVVPIPELPVTTCTQTVYYCDVNPNLEGIRPENCPDCYRDDPRVELLPLETETVNGVVRYKRKIIDWDNCRQCDFSFEVMDKACDFNVAFNEVISTNYPFTLTFFNTSSSGSGTAPCGMSQWIIDDLTAGVSFLYSGSAVNFTGQIHHEYQVCLSVSNCACGRACEKSFCKTFRIDDDGAHVSRLAQHSEEATAELFPVSKGIMVKPNPSSGKFVLENSYGLRVYDQVLITDMSGKTVLKMENMAAGFEYNLSDLAKGVYVVKITTSDGTKTTKLVLQ